MIIDEIEFHGRLKRMAEWNKTLRLHMKYSVAYIFHQLLVLYIATDKGFETLPLFVTIFSNGVFMYWVLCLVCMFTVNKEIKLLRLSHDIISKLEKPTNRWGHTN